MNEENIETGTWPYNIRCVEHFVLVRARWSAPSAEPCRKTNEPAALRVKGNAEDAE